jgi:hypothetical protein
MKPPFPPCTVGQVSSVSTARPKLVFLLIIIILSVSSCSIFLADRISTGKGVLYYSASPLPKVASLPGLAPCIFKRLAHYNNNMHPEVTYWLLLAQ